MPRRPRGAAVTWKSLSSLKRENLSAILRRRPARPGPAPPAASPQRRPRRRTAHARQGRSRARRRAAPHGNGSSGGDSAGRSGGSLLQAGRGGSRPADRRLPEKGGGPQAPHNRTV